MTAETALTANGCTHMTATYPEWMTNPAHRAVLDNARRLFDDAGLLFINDRFPTALSVGVLAYEEIGKIYLNYIDWTPADDKPKDNHVGKQLMANVLHLAEYGIPVIQRILTDAWGQPVEASVAVGLMAALQKDPDNPIFNGQGAEVSKALKAIVIESLKGTPAAEMRAHIALQGVDKQKKQGFYCDIRGEEIRSSPTAVTKEEAEAMLKIVARALSFIDRK